MRILIVEDDIDARELMIAVLTDAGATVEGADSAAAGLAALGTFGPQVLVSDIGMPDEDGYSLIRKIRSRGAADGGAIPAMALTAFTRAEDRARALDAGFTLHVTKPVLPTDLVNAVLSLAALVPPS